LFEMMMLAHMMRRLEADFGEPAHARPATRHRQQPPSVIVEVEQSQKERNQELLDSHEEMRQRLDQVGPLTGRVWNDQGSLDTKANDKAVNTSALDNLAPVYVQVCVGHARMCKLQGLVVPIQEGYSSTVSTTQCPNRSLSAV
jgi:hypothetical protein